MAFFSHVSRGDFRGWFLGGEAAKRKLHEMLTKLCRQEKIRFSAAVFSEGPLNGGVWGEDTLRTQIGVIFRG